MTTYDGLTFSRLVDMVEELLPPCEAPDSTGMYMCNQPGTVWHRELEACMCKKCFEVTP